MSRYYGYYHKFAKISRFAVSYCYVIVLLLVAMATLFLSRISLVHWLPCSLLSLHHYRLMLQIVESPCFPPAEVVNTLGAGDTFIAACIKALSNSLDLKLALTFACKVAGAKCGVRDIDELAGMKF